MIDAHGYCTVCTSRKTNEERREICRKTSVERLLVQVLTINNDNVSHQKGAYVFMNSNKLLDLLRQNARLTNKELAVMLDDTEENIAAELKRLEREGIIMGYSAIINEEKVNEDGVTAIIDLKITPIKDRGFDDLAHTIMEYEEVDSVFLLSGANDLSVTISGTSLRKVALFVSERLAVLDGVLSTTTHFILRRYKEKGHIFNEDNFDERGMVSP